MLFNTKFDYIVSLGEDCACASYLLQHNLRTCSGPFDWLTKAPFDTRINLICNDFEDFLTKEYFRFLPKTSQMTDTNCDYYENIKTDFYFYHDFKIGVPFDLAFEEVSYKYRRRIQRFYDKIQTSNNILFVWWSRDKKIAEQNIIDAYKKLSDKFPSTNVYIVLFENDLSKKSDMDTLYITDNVIKFISDFARCDINNPKTLTQGNKAVSNKVFSLISLKRPFKRRIKERMIKIYISIVIWPIRIRHTKKEIKAFLNKQLLGQGD